MEGSHYRDASCPVSLEFFTMDNLFGRQTHAPISLHILANLGSPEQEDCHAFRTDQERLPTCFEIQVRCRSCRFAVVMSVLRATC